MWQTFIRHAETGEEYTFLLANEGLAEKFLHDLVKALDRQLEIRREQHVQSNPA